jgi:hypothetical protein
MSMNPNNDPPQNSIKNVEELGLSTFNKLYSLFAKLWTPVQVLIAVAGLALALWYGNELRLSLLNTQNSVAMALGAKIEPTRNTDQGIAAFLLSNVKDEWDKAELLNIPNLHSILESVNTKVQGIGKAASTKQKGKAERNIPPANAPQAAPPPIPEIISKLNLEIINSDSTESWQTAIISNRKESFMVVPATSLRRKTLSEPSLVKEDRRQLQAVLEHNPEIAFDLYLASELEPEMRQIYNAKGEMLTVVQMYFITESGVFLIRAPGVKDHKMYYGEEFLTYNQYMDRPYFWGAVDIRRRRSTPAPFDYVSKPYVDLGGNGFVVTFSKKYSLPNQRVGVLCVDAKLPDYVTNNVEKYITDLGAKVSEFYWGKERGIETKTGLPLPQEFSWFQDKINESWAARSEVLGTIATEPPKPLSPQSQNKAGGVVRFTVPVGSTEVGEGNKKTRLLAVEIDSNSILNTLYKKLFLFAFGIALVIGLTVRLLVDYTSLKRETSKVLRKMSKVMQDASTPFVWLDDKNEFVKVNRSFLDVLGYVNYNIDGLKAHRRTFKSMVAGPSRQTYEDILKKSSANEETGEYEIDVLTKEDKVLHVRAHGERIPYPTFWRRGKPHRFGIFVEVIEPEPTADTEPTTHR